MNLTHISLFTGIGGIDLAAEWAGFETVLMVENDKYCQKVLNKHWPDVPIIGDIKDATKERIEETISLTKNKRIIRGERFEGDDDGEGGEWGNDDGRSGSNNGSKGNRNAAAADNFQPITLITGGFPCQPVSGAGKRKGKADDRWLWPEMLRVISEVRPTWVVAENVAGLLNMGFNDCVSDLESEGYEVTSFLIPACAVNAPHRRDRIFIVGYSRKNGLSSRKSRRLREVSGGGAHHPRSAQESSNVADTKARAIRAGLCENRQSREWGRRLGDNSSPADAPDSERPGLEGADTEGNSCTERQFGEPGQGEWPADWWAVEPELGRVAYGIPSRVDRLKCLGNAVVPQQIYPILKAIALIERPIKYSR